MNLSVLRSKGFRTALGVCALALIVAPLALSWGMNAHNVVSHEATQLLSGDLKGFFEANMASLLAFSNEPDIVSRTDPSEGPNHYLDLDMFDSPPFDRILADEDEFRRRFGAKAAEGGRLPWAAADRYKALVEALRARDYEKILTEAGYLSHYVADSTMPLHATKNYKGQFSGNVIFPGDGPERHVHVRFEIGMVDMHLDEIEEKVSKRAGTLRELGDPAAVVLENLKKSYEHINAVLEADRARLKPGETPSPEYYRALYNEVGWIAADQLTLATRDVAGLWQRAWLEAGSPKLPAAEVVLSRKAAQRRAAERGGPGDNETENTN